MAAPEAPLLYQGVPRTSAAFRLLKQMGWHEGEGLGREKQGITEHLRVTKKKDNSGLGIDPQLKAANNWTFNTSVFDSILKNLKVIVADADVVEEKHESVSSAWIVNKKDSKKATRPQGRYKRRELGKIVKGKSQADLDAILGYGSKTRDGASFAETVTRHPERCSPVGAPEAGCDHGGSSERLVEENKTKLTGEHPVAVKPVESLKGIPIEKSMDDWWGTKHGFVQGGLLGGITSHDMKGIKETKSNKSGILTVEEVGSACRASFCEQDQEDLCKKVQEKARKGRQGLGIASRPKKIGGAHWKGQKVILDMGVDDKGQNQEDRTIQDDFSLHSDATCNGGAHKRKLHSIYNLEGDREGVSKKKKSKDRRINVKWKSLCEELLKQAPTQTMNIKHLHKQIVALSDLYSNNDPHHSKEATSSFKEKLKSSSKFIVEGKKVSLAISKGLSSPGH